MSMDVETFEAAEPEQPDAFKVDPDIFPVEHLVLDRLYANLVECQSSIELCELMLLNDLDPIERTHYETRLDNDRDQEVLLRQLIERKRASETEEKV